jgi:hypothetical protein
LCQNNPNKAFTKSAVILDFTTSEFLYPNGSIANTINMVTASGSTQEITAVHFPASSNNAIEINYIGLPS